MCIYSSLFIQTAADGDWIFFFKNNSSYEPSCVCLLMYRCKNFLGFMPKREITGLWGMDIFIFIR